jgi:hypothetical protein
MFLSTLRKGKALKEIKLADGLLKLGVCVTSQVEFIGFEGKT